MVIGDANEIIGVHGSPASIIRSLKSFKPEKRIDLGIAFRSIIFFLGSLLSMNKTVGCSNASLVAGICFDLPVCGFCYNFGEQKTGGITYERYNLVIF
jgi:hypothetical protein